MGGNGAAFAFRLLTRPHPTSCGPPAPTSARLRLFNYPATCSKVESRSCVPEAHAKRDGQTTAPFVRCIWLAHWVRNSPATQPSVPYPVRIGYHV